MKRFLKVLFIALGIIFLTSSVLQAAVRIFPRDLAGFNAAAGSPPIVINFDNIPPDTNITGTTISGVKFIAINAPLLVVRGMDTYTPAGFLYARDPSTNKLYPTSGANVLSPGGKILAPGPNVTIENDDLILIFEKPVSSFGLDFLWQSADGASYTNIYVYDKFNTLLYFGGVPSSDVGGSGGPAGADFWGIVSDSANISRIVIDEYDDNEIYPDSNIGFDTFRFPRIKTLTAVRAIDTISAANIDLDMSSFSKQPFKITTDADKTIIEWQFDTFDIGQIEDLFFDVILKNPIPGEDRLVNQQLELIYNDIDGNEVRTAIGPHYVHVLDTSFEAGIATDKPAYQANENVVINARIKNLSEFARTVDAKILIEDSKGALVTALTTLANINFAAGEEKTFGNLVFNTGTTLSGSYRAHLILLDGQKQVGDALANFIIGADIGVSSMVATDKMTYQVYEPVTITSTVQSTSANYILTDLTAHITLKDSAGAALFTDTKTIPILTPGSRLEFNSFWNTAANPAGMYTVMLEILKGTTSLSVSQTSFSIPGSSGTAEGIIGTISATPSPIYRGNKETIAYSIRNIGNMDIANLQIQVLIVNPDTKEIKRTYNTSATIAMGSASESGFSISTIPLEPRKYLVILQVQSASMSEPKTIANTLFEVVPGLEATKAIPDMINLLVWINDKCDHHPAQKGVECPEPQPQDCIRVDLLERILNEAGVSYRIVYDKDAFEQEMRNPFYTDFMILGDQTPLTDHHADELREQVYSGKGLLSSLYLKHGICIGPEHEDEPLFGLTYHGKLPGFTHNIDIPEGPLSGKVSFTARGDALRVEAEDPGQILGWIGWQKGENCNPIPKDYPGIVKNQYGVGKTLFFAFDIGKTLDEGTYQIISEIIKKGLSLIHTPANTELFSPYQYVPIAITLKNLDGAIDLRITETYPQGLTIYDPSTGKWITDRPWQFDVHLDSEETVTIFYYAFTPDQAGTHVLQTTIEYMENGSYYPCQMLSVSLPIAQDATQTAQAILDALNTLQVSTHTDKAAIKLAMMFIYNVKTRTVRSPMDAEKNIDDILKAIDALLSVESVDTTAIQLMMDELLKIWEARAYLLPHSPPHS